MPYTAPTPSLTFLLPNNQPVDSACIRQWPLKRGPLSRKQNREFGSVLSSSPTKHSLTGVDLNSQPLPIPISAQKTSKISSPCGSPKKDYSITKIGSLRIASPSRRGGFGSSPDRFSLFQPQFKENNKPKSLPATIRKKSGEVVKSSLKRSSKSAPPTPTCPKFVHFDPQLERVRLFLQEETPEAVKTDPVPRGDTKSDEPQLTLVLPNWPVMTTSSISKTVLVESVSFNDNKTALIGRVQVRNIAFHKSVAVRYTFDYWQSVCEVSAEYKEGVKNGAMDRFVFTVELEGKVGGDLSPEDEQRTMYFAVRYNVDGREFWDNNNGMNYMVEMKRSTPPTMPSGSWTMDRTKIKATSTETNTTDLFSSSPPILSSSPKDGCVVPKTRKKKLGNRYDFGASLTAATKKSASHVAPLSRADPSPLSRRNGSDSFPTHFSPIPGVTTATQIVDGFPISLGFPDEYLSASVESSLANPPWEDSGNALPQKKSSEYTRYGSSPSVPISIPKSRSSVSIAANNYYDLVNKYCFYAGSTSPYSASPYSNSPPAPLIRG